MKEKTSKNMTSRTIVSYFEISVLVIGLFAFAFMIAETNKLTNNKVADEKVFNTNKTNKLPNLMELIGSFFSGWMKRSSIKLVSAEILQCCPKLKAEFSGGACQDIASSQCLQQCSNECLPAKCEQIESCKPGCCIDNKEGLCENSVPKELCTNSGGAWKNDKNCNIAECSLGCCVLGNNAEFATEARCKKLSNLYSLQEDFRADVNTELGCLSLASQQDEGACVFDSGGERACKFISKQECMKITGSTLNFYKDNLCTNPELNTICKKSENTGCIEGKDEVYFKDSCGNPANIYDASRINDMNYWKQIASKENSCNPDSDSCGNCNYFSGSICGAGKAKYGNYICKDVNCKNAPDLVDAFGKVLASKDRKNGESWCVYDSVIGNGKDSVGSRHYKYYCVDGQAKSEPCGDYRTGICVESKIRGNAGEISQASCRTNQAEECLSYNANDENKNEDGSIDAEKLIKQCNENIDCEIRHLDFGKNYKFDVCTSKYPIGFNLDNENEAKVDEAVCNQANFKCVKVQVKKLSGWKCVSGCDCDSQKFTQQMNDWCVSLGDCGGKANIAGEATSDGYSISGAPKIDLNQYKKNALPVAGQKAEPGNFTNLLASYYGWGAGNSEGLNQQDYSNIILGASAGVGGIAAVSALATTTSVVSGASLVGEYGFQTALSLILQNPSVYLGSVGGPLAAAAIGASIGTAVGLIIGKIFGLQGEATLITALVGASSGIILTFTGSIGLFGAKAGASCFSLGPAGAICLAVVIIIVILASLVMKLLGIGETKTKTATFTCQPWQAPRGGDSCDKCNVKGLKPCTEYKCKSLGQNCELTNIGTTNELCIENKLDDINPPVISPWNDFISNGYKYSENTKGFQLIGNNGECIQEFQTVIFGIATNKASQCKYNIIHTTDWDSMGDNYFGESSLYLKNHGTAFYLPSIDSLLESLSEEIDASQLASLKSIAVKKYGNLTLYVRCNDKNGHYNLNEYMINTCINSVDITPPVILASQPADNSCLAYNTNSSLIKIYVNEPASCRYEYSDNKYEKMNKNFSCNNNDYETFTSASGGGVGYPCNAEIDLKQNNTIYIRCKDKPNLPENNETRKAMASSYQLTLKKSPSKLEIASLEPNGIINSEAEPATAILKAVTSGGCESGKAYCEFSLTGNIYTGFLNTFSLSHEQELNQMIRGNYTAYIKCKDNSGNEAKANTNFSIEILEPDLTPPIIVRVYNEAGNLKIITDEDSNCLYSNKNCDMTNASAMLGDSKEHFAEWKTNSYYIKCSDEKGNAPDGCSIIIKT